jgi:hypothetical protein
MMPDETARLWRKVLIAELGIAVLLLALLVILAYVTYARYDGFGPFRSIGYIVFGGALLGEIIRRIRHLREDIGPRSKVEGRRS